MKHVAVLMGGWSAEREISLRSGKACADALERSGYQVSRIDVDRDVAATLRARKPDVALNVLHGRPGEDGTLQGLLEVLGIPYSHSGVLASALAMKKDIAKSVLKSVGVPVPGGMVAARKEAAKRHLLPPPYVIKPVAEGSSVGVFIVREDHIAPAAGTDAGRLGVRRPDSRRALYSRQGAHLRGDGRPGTRRDRNRPDREVLRLRSQIRAGRLEAPFAGTDRGRCLSRGATSGARRTPCARLPWRDTFGFPL